MCKGEVVSMKPLKSPAHKFSENLDLDPVCIKGIMGENAKLLQ